MKEKYPDLVITQYSTPTISLNKGVHVVGPNSEYQYFKFLDQEAVELELSSPPDEEQLITIVICSKCDKQISFSKGVPVRHKCKETNKDADGH